MQESQSLKHSSPSTSGCVAGNRSVSVRAVVKPEEWCDEEPEPKSVLTPRNRDILEIRGEEEECVGGL